jgi:hypothetical protein
VVPNVRGVVSLSKYSYFERARPVNASGFPVPTQALQDVRLSDGVEVSMPSQGVVFLTTLESSAHVTIGRGAPTPVTYLGIRDPGETVALGTSFHVALETDPPGRSVRWSVTSPDGKPTDLATVDPGGVLLAKHLGKVLVTASSGALKATTEVEIGRYRVIVDPLDDWHRTFSHTGNWTFDTINNSLFEGDPSHAKRDSDTRQSITYRCSHLISFTAKVYYTGGPDNKVRFWASADNLHWTTVETRSEPPVPTGGDIKRTRIRPVRLPPGTTYLRIEFANDPQVWSPQLGEMRLVATGQ